MSEHQKKRYYFLQLPKDFFKSHPLDILRAMEGGREALLLYVELLAESTGHDGHLLFSDNKPFTPALIAAKFQTDITIVKESLALLEELELLNILENGELFLPNFAEYVGSKSNMAEYMANRRSSNNKKITEGLQEDNKGITKDNNVINSIEYRDKSIESRVKSTENIKKESVSNISRARTCEGEDSSKPLVPSQEPERVKHGNLLSPTLTDVLKVANDATHLIHGKVIDQAFAREWFDIQCQSGWKDTRGMSVIPGWRAKLAYAWKDEQKARAREDAEKRKDELASAEEERKRDEWNRRMLSVECDD